MPSSSFLSQNLRSVSFSSERSSAFENVRHKRRRERFVRPMMSSSISDAETSSTTNTNENKNTKRVVVITGGNTGLGCISAREIARLSSMNADDENGGKEKEFIVFRRHRLSVHRKRTEGDARHRIVFRR